MALVIGLSVLTGCGNSIGSIEPPELLPAPEDFTEDCVRPVILPERELSQAEVASFWAFDRTNLANCADIHEAAIEFYERRDQLVMGSE